METKKKPKAITPKSSMQIFTYTAAICVFTLIIFFFSVFMASVASVRNGISQDNFINTTKIYEPLTQNAPNLDLVDTEVSYYRMKNITPEIARKYAENTFLTSTDGKVMIEADFVKKGLVYQPTYKTQFNATYILKNTLEEESYIVFQFPFPVNTNSSEISNAILKVNGEEIKNSKTTFDTSSYSGTTSGMKWEGKVDPLSEITIDVSYNTVGISVLEYQGIENPKEAQDFKFAAEIIGTRSYDVLSGLSVDERQFGDNKVTLIWDKDSLYNRPVIDFSVGDKLNPSEQVSRIYFTMAPIYLVFAVIVTFLTFKFGKKIIGIFDLFLMTVLFGIYFPLIHYLSSFTIDPTIDIFSSLNVTQYSMSLYVAFGLAFTLIGSLVYYLIGKISGFGFSTKFVVPSLILFLGFFPLVVTIPEYSMLLVIIGSIALMMIIIQVRIRIMNQEALEEIGTN